MPDFLNQDGTSFNWGAIGGGLNALGGVAGQYFSAQANADAMKAIEGGRNAASKEIAEINAQAAIEIARNQTNAALAAARAQSGSGAGMGISGTTLIIGGVVALIATIAITVALMR